MGKAKRNQEAKASKVELMAKLKTLKSLGYDLIAQKEEAERQLNDVNQQIIATSQALQKEK